MNMSEVKGFEGVPGIPEGWELVAVRKASCGEYMIDSHTGPYQWTSSSSIGVYPIIREVPKPEPKYRAFASAEEFKPHRDKWILRLDEEDGTSNPAYGAWRADSYDEESIISDEEISYEELLKYRFEDGTLCGILINP